jgi:hypothetical protein
MEAREKWSYGAPPAHLNMDYNFLNLVEASLPPCRGLVNLVYSCKSRVYLNNSEAKPAFNTKMSMANLKV